jgi:hypothetical protein
VPSRLSRYLPPAVALLAVLVFVRVVGFGFVYDDRWTLVDNAWLAHPLGELWRLLAGRGALAHHVPDATRPAMVLMEAVERRVFGLAPWGYHLDSLVLYACVCALVARLALVLSRKRRVALLAAPFFAVAPLHAEAVAAVNYREDLLAACGMLCALLAFCRRDQPPQKRAAWAVGHFALGFFGFALALFSKESAVALVPMALVIVHCVPWARESLRANRPLLYGLAYVLVSWLAWRVPLSLHGDDIPLAPARPFGQVLLRTARFEVLAVRYALAPLGGTPDHWRLPDASFGWALPCLSLFAAVFLLGQLRSTRLLALGLGIALTAPLACSPLFRPVNELADRYFFLSILGGGLCWGWALERVAPLVGQGRRRTSLVWAWVLLLVPARLAINLWHDERSLWTATVALTPSSPRAWAGLSRAHRLAGEREAADRTLARALWVDPNYTPALVTEVYNDLSFGRLGLARERLGALKQRRVGEGGGIAKAKRCALLDADAAARCIDAP